MPEAAGKYEVKFLCSRVKVQTATCCRRCAVCHISLHVLFCCCLSRILAAGTVKDLRQISEVSRVSVEFLYVTRFGVKIFGAIMPVWLAVGSGRAVDVYRVDLYQLLCSDALRV